MSGKDEKNEDKVHENDVHIFTCNKGCCIIKQRDYTEIKPHIRRHGICKKAGVFFYDPKNRAVLLVQSRGQLWGPPKGSVEDDKNETDLECAIREAREETGIKISAGDLLSTEKLSIKNRASYYFMEKTIADVSVQGPKNNDANGISWIKISCLLRQLEEGRMFLNQHCKLLFKKFLGINFFDLPKKARNNRVFSKNSNFIEDHHRNFLKKSTDFLKKLTPDFSNDFSNAEVL